MLSRYSGSKTVFVWAVSFFSPVRLRNSGVTCFIFRNLSGNKNLVFGSTERVFSRWPARVQGRDWGGQAPALTCPWCDFQPPGTQKAGIVSHFMLYQSETKPSSLCQSVFCKWDCLHNNLSLSDRLQTVTYMVWQLSRPYWSSLKHTQKYSR